MNAKHFIWFGAIVGSIVGGLVPELWHASMLSLWGMTFSTIGAVVGIWLCWKMTR
jgi:uncharacterized membrane protein YeaQ/YmgE (transglycosylase-associated protein family)